MTRPLKQRGSLGELTKIGQGGQGVVYHAPGVRTKFSASLVYKEYKPDQRDHTDFETLAKMPALVENSLVYADGERLISIAAWPCEVVENNGEPTGFVMPEIPDQFFIALTTMKGVSRNRAEFQHLLNNEAVLGARGITIDDVQRYRLLREVASGLAFLHSHSVCVGDISPNNLLFSLTAKQSIYFIDCDSVCINGVSALTQVETPGWEVPAGEAKATIYSDSYKLGLLALRLLAGDQDTRNVNDLPSHTPSMVRRIISDALRTEPQKRPLPEVWTYQLGYAIEEAQDRQASLPASSPPKPATPPAPSRGPANAVSAPPRPPASAQATPSNVANTPSDKLPAVAWALAVAVVALIGIIVVAGLNSLSDSGTSSSSSTSTSSSNDDGTSSTVTSTTTASSTAPSAQWGPPPDAIKGADRLNDDSCGNHGFPVGPGLVAAPAAPSEPASFTSCGFAKAVGLQYASRISGQAKPDQVSVHSPDVTCRSVQAANPAVNVQCDGDNFLMQCKTEGTTEGVWIACRGGKEAVVYIW